MYYNPDYLWYKFRYSPPSENLWLYNRRLLNRLNKVIRIHNTQKNIIWSKQYDKSLFNSLLKGADTNTDTNTVEHITFNENEYFHPLRVLDEKYVDIQARSWEKSFLGPTLARDLDLLQLNFWNLDNNISSWKRFYFSDYYKNFTYHIKK